MAKYCECDNLNQNRILVDDRPYCTRCERFIDCRIRQEAVTSSRQSATSRKEKSRMANNPSNPTPLQDALVRVVAAHPGIQAAVAARRVTPAHRSLSSAHRAIGHAVRAGRLLRARSLSDRRATRLYDAASYTMDHADARLAGVPVHKEYDNA